MSDAFDPYHRWLGIPPSEQPADHYRLLGITLFEDNPDVIEAAADRQMGHLRTYQTGKHSQESQKLLNEVAEAKVCLLSANKKTAYDVGLRRRLKAETTAEAIPVAEHLPPAQQPGTSGVPALGIDVASPSKRVLRRKRSGGPWAAVVVGVGVLVVVGLLLALRSGQQAPQAGRKDGERGANRQPFAPADRLPGAFPPAPLVEDEKTGGPPSTDEAESGKQTTAIDRSGEELHPSPSTLPVVPSPSQAEPPAKASEKLPAPSQAAQQEIAGQIEQVYDFAGAKTGAQKLQLAGRLLGLGGQAQAKPAKRFVLLRKAMELAAEGGDANLMLEAADALGAEFQIDLLGVRESALEKFAQKATDARRIEALVEASRAFIDQTLAEERYELALSMATAAHRAASRPTGREFRKETYDRRAEVQRLHDEWKQFQQAEATLKANPQDPAANLIVGRWHCFNRGDWDEGLVHLAKGTDEGLKSLAEQELASESTDPREQVRLAEVWWDLAEQKTGATKRKIRSRAVHWYRKAAPRLTTSDKVKVEKRLDEARQATEEQETDSKVAKKKPRVLCRIYACCDNSFIMYVNGEEVLSAVGPETGIKDYEFSKGDVITVLAKNRGSKKGFCCVIMSQKGQVITTAAGWRGYRPTSEVEWFMPDKTEQTYSVVPSLTSATWPVGPVQAASGIKAPAIWGQGELCYLMFVVQ